MYPHNRLYLLDAQFIGRITLKMLAIRKNQRLAHRLISRIESNALCCYQ